MTKLFTAGKKSGQGNSVYGNTMIVSDNRGACQMYDMRNGCLLAEFHLGSYNDGTAPDGSKDNAWSNHANQMMFGAARFRQDDPFPLLYVTTGNSGAHDRTGAYICKCAVERILYDEENGWYAELVQIIEFHDKENIPQDDPDGVLTDMYQGGRFLYSAGNGYDAARGYEKVSWGWPASFADSEPTSATAGKFYLKGARFRTYETYEKANKIDYGITGYREDNAYIVTEFDMPALPTDEAAADYGGTVTLYPRDITDQFSTEYEIGVTQGGTMYRGRIYYSYGNGSKDAYTRNGIQVFDIAERKIIARLPLWTDEETKGYEPECTAVWNGKLILGFNGDGYQVYALDQAELYREGKKADERLEDRGNLWQRKVHM